MAKRTRKWALVAQEAQRLAALNLSPREIAAQLGLNKSTVTRWIAGGKLPKSATTRRRRTGKAQPLLPGQTPEEWASAVRLQYALDATDEQLVTLAQDALTAARDQTIALRLRLNSMSRFAAIVKQLALVTRQPDDAPTPEPPKVEPAPRERREDPRAKALREVETIQ